MPPKFKCHLNHYNVKSESKNLLKDFSGGEEDSFSSGPSEPSIRPRNDKKEYRRQVDEVMVTGKKIP
uniref:Uncharacterized protein n=1 Tax=Prolemur simus TaxID=1328070 RepID=A0A8C9A877_PROSS